VSRRIADGALQVGDAGDDKIVADGHVSGRIADSALRVGGATYGQEGSSQGGEPHLAPIRSRYTKGASESEAKSGQPHSSYARSMNRAAACAEQSRSAPWDGAQIAWGSPSRARHQHRPDAVYRCALIR